MPADPRPKFVKEGERYLLLGGRCRSCGLASAHVPPICPSLERLLTCYPQLAPASKDPHWIPTMLSRGMESFPVSLGESRT